LGSPTMPQLKPMGVSRVVDAGQASRLVGLGARRQRR
jgi:hypothetical protein